MLSKWIARLIKVTTIVFISSSYATPIVQDLDNCQVGNATLDSITTLGSNSNLLSTSYDATKCLGYFAGGNDEGAYGQTAGSRNIGELGDGILNGQGGFFTGLEFIETSDLQNLDGIGPATDPGWIHLARFGENGVFDDYSTAGPSYISPLVLDIGNLLTLSLACDNPNDCKAATWTLTTKVDIIDQVTQLLGNATFDHLAFSIKGANGFAVYDFNFKTIFGIENTINPDRFNFNTPYELSGTLKTNDLLNAKGNNFGAISHLNVWARDPSVTVDVNEPQPILLMLLALTLLVISRKSKAN